MNRIVLVDAVGCRTRAALLEDGVLAEIIIENDETSRMTGNIYIGRVNRVLPGMQAAFLDIGLNRDAFLHAADIVSNGLTRDDAEPVQKNKSETEDDWSDRVKPGQFLLVQMKREPLDMKGARVTMHIMLPGRYVVLMPTIQQICVSKRIHSEQERARLTDILKELSPDGMGVIARTAAEGQDIEDIAGDIRDIEQTWKDILRRARKTRTPGCLHSDLGPALRLLRDVFEDSVSEVLVESDELYHSCRSFVSRFAPDWVDRIKRYAGPEPLFTHFGIEKELRIAAYRKVWLPSGGYIIIDSTEALVAIDVNTGRNLGKSDFEETVFRTNLEAADVIARQVRLRNIGGIIIVDFIDMASEDRRNAVLKRLREAFGRDRTPVHISSFSPLGLVEMTRRRTGPCLDRVLRQVCPHCKGSGHILHPQTVSGRVEQELEGLPSRKDKGFVTVVVHPSLSPYLDCRIDEIRRRLSERGYRLRLVYDSSIWHDVYKINVT